MNLIDIIIPTYNNKDELYRSLFSIGANEKVNIIIVDDGSIDQDYNEIEKFFSKFFSIKFYMLEKNSGPAIARQVGLSKAKSKYIMFLDCGDQIFSPFMINSMLDVMENNEELYMTSYQDFEETENGYTTIASTNNRIRGKIFLRKFLEQYNIHFCRNYPYANEDISFVSTARMILEDLESKGQKRYLNVDAPATIWTLNPESLVHKDDNVFNFKHQNKGLAYNSLEAEAIARANKVNSKIIERVIIDNLCYMYVSYLNTLTLRREYESDSFFGAAYYYSKNYEYFKNMDGKFIIESYKRTMTLAYSNKEPMTQIPQDLTFYKFLEKLEEVHTQY